MTEVETQAHRVVRAKRTRRSGMSQGWGVLISQILLIAVIIGLWQLAAVFEWGRPILVRSPGEVVQAFVDMSNSGLLWSNYGATLYASLIALVLSIAVGVPLGLALGMFPFSSRVFSPILNAINATPRIALAPIFIVIFGITTESKVAVAFSLAVFVMLLNAQAGMRAADPESVRMLTVMGASRAEILWKAILPSAVPSLLAGVRLTVIFSLLGVISAELIAAKDGLGQVIARASAAFDMASTYAVLILLILTAAALNIVGDRLERRLLRWQPPQVK